MIGRPRRSTNLRSDAEISGKMQFAFQVPDLKAATERLLAHGATMVHPAVLTPWGDQNVRFQDPDGMQVTLYQVPDRT